MEAKLYGQNKGGMSINGIIKDYYAYAGENISAGDLVEYVNGVAGKTDLGTSVDTQLSTNTYTGSTISAVQLDENRVFIAHSSNSSGSKENYLYGMVCTINGAAITVGTDTQLNTGYFSGYAISAVRLDNNRVFITHSNATSYYLYGMVVKIDGTTITAGNDKAIQTLDSAGYVISACLLPNGNVFIAHSQSSSYSYLYGIVCTINDTTISYGTDTELSSARYTGSTISTCLLPNGNVFIAHSYGSNYYLYGIVCSISGTTITKGSDTVLVNSSNAGSTFDICLLDNENVFVAHSYGSALSLRGMVISISGTSITKYGDTEITGGENTGKLIKTHLLPNGNVLLIRGYSNYQCLYPSIVEINGTTITEGKSIEIMVNGFGWGGVSSILLNNGNVFIAHSHTTNIHYLYAQIFTLDEDNVLTNNIIANEYETQVRQVTTGQFDGIAKTSGTGGDNTGHKDLVSIWTGVTYTPVSYIESTKTQWIDTNYFVKYGDVVTFDMAFLDTQSYLGYYSSNTNRFGLGVAKGAYEIVNGSNSSVYKPVSDTERHTFVIDTTGQIKFDDTAQSVAAMATDFEAAFSIGLFGRKQAATSTSLRGQHRVYRFAVERGSELIMNLIPCRRDSDGVLGLRDEVTGKFYTNAGTGTFTAG